MDDEYHVVYEVLNRSYAHIATHFYVNDPFVPFTLLYKLIAGTAGLDEMNMRLPPASCGVLSIIVFPLFARPLLRSGEFLTFAFLLAISPHLIHYSRWARPYSITTLFCGVALVAFVGFLRRRQRKYLLMYSASAVTAVYFHPMALPFVLAPPVFAIITVLFREPNDLLREVGRIAVPAAVVVVVLATLLGPPVFNSVTTMGSYVDVLSAPPADVVFSFATLLQLRAAMQVAFGVKYAWLAAAMLLTAALGAGLFLRRDPWLGGCLVVAGVCQVVAISLAAPRSLQWCGVFLRYNLWVLPILLLFCSVGLNAVRRKPYGAIVTVAVLSVIAFASPLPGIYWKPNNFMNAPSFQLAFTQPAQRAWLASIGDRASEFFRRLAEEPGGLIVETPWLGVNLSVFNGQLQAIHRHPVAIGFLDDWGPGWFPLWHPDLHFRNFVKATDLAEMQRRGARYLVIHKHLRNEVEHLLPWKMPEGYPAPSLEKYEARWWATLGAPIYEDRWIRVHAVPPADPHLAGPDP